MDDTDIDQADPDIRAASDAVVAVLNAAGSNRSDRETTAAALTALTRLVNGYGGGQLLPPLPPMFRFH